MNNQANVPSFPFGQKLKKVIQSDRTPTKVFVLGVYASAVHARWVDKNGNRIVAALAVASEPEIFWRGDNAEEIIRKIIVPGEAGMLTRPIQENLNGPSGRALDGLYLEPLGYGRKDAWLCDLLPESRVNPNQRRAVDAYNKINSKYNLPTATIPNFDRDELNSGERRNEVLEELRESRANTIILLGDLPIKCFLQYFTTEKYTKLSDFGNAENTYGKPHSMKVADMEMNVIPLCHPRQAGKLGKSNLTWGRLHERWIHRLRMA